MSTMNLPLEIYDTLERKLGREDAMAIAKSIERSLGHIEQRSYDVAAQRKLEVREELRVEMRDELATKADMAKLQADMASLRGEIQADLAKLQGYVDARFEQVNTRFERLDKKFTLMFGVLVFLIIFLNQNALEFILKVVGILK